MVNGNKLALGFPVRLRGRAEPFFAVGNAVHHAGLRGDGDLISNIKVSGEPDLSGENYIIAQPGAA